MKQLCVKAAPLLGVVGLLLGGVGCQKEYGKVRPPVDELSADGRGLQGKDVISASDRMAQSLLSLPALNASTHQWVIVCDRVENMTSTQRQNLDIFLTRTRVRLAQLGQGRIQLIENREKLRQLQSRELDGSPDRFSQGGLGGAPTGRLQPDFSLTATLSDLPNNESTYFLADFRMVNLRDGTSPWQDMYEIATYR
ncbi:MAG TPA: hypothetical protein VF595_04495 [Tepidisphaeraceae bacterium]